MEPTRIREPDWGKAAIALVVVLVLSIVGLIFMGSQTSAILSTVGASVGGGGQVVGGDTTGGDQPGDQGGTDGSGGGSGAGGSGADGVITAVPRAEPRIIKTGTLTLQVDDIEGTIRAATTAIDALGGYASASKREGAGADARATTTFRVPAERWDEAMTAVRGLTGEVLAEESSTDDVTAQVVDLGARIRNLQATEAALQSIMDRATLIKDVLSVQAELTTVRGEIEQLSAQQAHLEEQAAYSTLTATFVRTPAPVLVTQQDRFDPASEVDAASARLVGVLQDVATAGIWFGIVWLPMLLALGVVGGVAVFVLRRLRRRSAWEPVGN
jgi:hypothetical protein